MAKGINRKDLKELREPDEFLSLSQRFLDYAKANERQVTAAALAVVVLVAVALGIRWYRASQLEAAEAAFGKAYAEFSAGRWEAAANGFEGVSSGWPHTAPGRLAVAFRGNALAELGKLPEAQASYDAVLRAGAKDSLLEQIALYNLGELKKKGGDAKGAASELGRAAAIEGPLRGAAWLSRLSTQQPFEENASLGMKAISELPPEARAYVESRTGSAAGGASSGGDVVEGAKSEK